MRPSPNDYKDLNPSDRNVRVVDGSLILKNIQKSHEGYYLCKASNGIGGISAVAKMSGMIFFYNHALVSIQRDIIGFGTPSTMM